MRGEGQEEGSPERPGVPQFSVSATEESYGTRPSSHLLV